MLDGTATQWNRHPSSVLSLITFHRWRQCSLLPFNHWKSFTARRYASAMLAPVSVCSSVYLCLCLSQVLNSMETAEQIDLVFGMGASFDCWGCGQRWRAHGTMHIKRRLGFPWKGARGIFWTRHLIELLSWPLGHPRLRYSMHATRDHIDCRKIGHEA